MNLLPIMIVEDEKFLMEDLLSIINWEQAGFQIVATAINGEQGIEKFYQHNPELILTDIKMPIIDGLSMMKSIRQFSPSTQFIIISAYSDFEYAQEALRLGAIDYILKTSISPEYICEKLERIKDIIFQQQSLHLSSFQKMLEDYIDSKVTITPNDTKLLLNSIHQKINPHHIPLYVDAATASFKKFIHYNKLNLVVDSPCIQSLDDLNNWLYRKITSIKQTSTLYLEEQLSPVVVTAYNYIRENYDNPNLKISNISDAVGLSSSRLSVLFKEELHKTVNEIITEIRIDEAKHLLRWQNLMVYEVAERVGYKTSQYFSKVFFKYTGQYPNTYHEISLDN